MSNSTSSAQSAVQASMSKASKASNERRITSTFASRDTRGSMASQQAGTPAAGTRVLRGDEDLLAPAAQQLDGGGRVLERVGDDAAVALGHGGQEAVAVLGEQVLALAQRAAVEGGEAGEGGGVGGDGGAERDACGGGGHAHMFLAGVHHGK